MSEWATIVSVNSLLALERVDEAIKILEDSEEWLNKNVGKTDPAKMATFYAAFSLALYRGGRRTDSMLATEHVFQWLTNLEPTGYFLCWAFYNNVNVCLSLAETSPSQLERKVYTKKSGKAIKGFNAFRKLFQFSVPWYHLVNGRYDSIIMLLNDKVSVAYRSTEKCRRAMDTSIGND
jgi:hypothetical protein